MLSYDDDTLQSYWQILLYYTHIVLLQAIYACLYQQEIESLQVKCVYVYDFNALYLYNTGEDKGMEESEEKVTLSDRVIVEV